MGGACSTNGEKRNECMKTYVDNIKMDLGDIGWCCMDCTVLVQDRNKCVALLKMVMSS
jgi:hypothetical protein